MSAEFRSPGLCQVIATRNIFHFNRCFAMPPQQDSYQEQPAADVKLPVACPGAFIPVSRAQAASILDVSVRTLENWQKSGEMPRGCSIGGRVYWHPRVFHQWLETRLLAPCSHGSPLGTPHVEKLQMSVKKSPAKSPRVDASSRARSRNQVELAKMAAGGQ